MNNNRRDARQQLKLFLSALFLPDELIELRFIESWTDDGRRISRVVRSALWLKSAELLAQHNMMVRMAERERANIYFGVCPRARKGDSHDELIRTVRCLWCDMDDVTDREAMDRWRAADVPDPSIVVNSGAGIHAYWLLDRDVRTADDRFRVVSMLPFFYRSFGGDHVQNLSRVLRLPGTMNYKDARNSRPARPCAMLRYDSTLVHPLEVFSRWMLLADNEQRLTRSNDALAVVNAAETQANLCRSSEVAELIMQLDRPTADRSRRDFAIVCDLLRLGLGKEQIWELVSAHSKFDSNGRPYFNVTVSNAQRSIRGGQVSAY